jgi:hypothetical protein
MAQVMNAITSFMKPPRRFSTRPGVMSDRLSSLNATAEAQAVKRN